MVRQLDQDFEILPRVINVPPHLKNPPRWKEEAIKVVKYIDEALILEKCNVHDDRAAARTGQEENKCS